MPPPNPILPIPPVGPPPHSTEVLTLRDLLGWITSNPQEVRPGVGSLHYVLDLLWAKDRKRPWWPRIPEAVSVALIEGLRTSRLAAHSPELQTLPPNPLRIEALLVAARAVRQITPAALTALRVYLSEGSPEASPDSVAQTYLVCGIARLKQDIRDVLGEDWELR